MSDMPDQADSPIKVRIEIWKPTEDDHYEWIVAPGPAPIVIPNPEGSGLDDLDEFAFRPGEIIPLTD